MADPIRSISQNNFLLATQQEVSHDNTLSGNGTEESPLGLNGSGMWTDITSQFTFKNTVTWGDIKKIYYSQPLNLVLLNLGFNCTSTGEVLALEGPLKYFPKDGMELIMTTGSGTQRFVDLSRLYTPTLVRIRSGTATWMSINVLYVPYGLDT